MSPNPRTVAKTLPHPSSFSTATGINKKSLFKLSAPWSFIKISVLVITVGRFVYLAIAREENHLLTLCHWCVRVYHREPAEDSNCITLHPWSTSTINPVGDILLLAVTSSFILFTLHPEPPEPAQSSGFLVILALDQRNTLTRQTLFTFSSDSSIILTLEYQVIDQHANNEGEDLAKPRALGLF